MAIKENKKIDRVKKKKVAISDEGDILVSSGIHHYRMARRKSDLSERFNRLKETKDTLIERINERIDELNDIITRKKELVEQAEKGVLLDMSLSKPEKALLEYFQIAGSGMGSEILDKLLVKQIDTIARNSLSIKDEVERKKQMKSDFNKLKNWVQAVKRAQENYIFPNP